MTIREVISDIDNQSEEAIIFAKKENAQFLPYSEVIVVELTDEELDEPIEEMAEKHCPGFHYFLEVAIVKDLVGAFDNTVGYKSLDQQVERIIKYAEQDA